MNLNKKHIFIIILIVLVIIIAGCNDQNISEKNKYSVSGIVLDKNGNPLPDVKIKCTGSIQENKDIDFGTVTSNENGKFTITGLIGTVELNPVKEGYNLSKEIVTKSTNDLMLQNNNFYTLKIETYGKGKVLKKPNKKNYQKDKKVTLIAQPAEGWNFDHWEGKLISDSNESPEIIIGQENDKVKAVFREEKKDDKQNYNIKYTLTVGEEYKNIYIEVIVDSINMKKLRLGKMTRKYEILNTDNSLINQDEGTWELEVNENNKVYVKYKIDLSEDEEKLSSTFLYENGNIFVVPLKNDSESEILNFNQEVNIKFNLPDEWETINSFSEVENNTFKTKNLYELRRGAIFAGEVRWKSESIYSGIDISFVVPKAPDEESKFSGLNTNYALTHQYDLSIKKDVNKISKRVAFALNYFSNQWNHPHPDKYIISSFDVNRVRWGMVHYDPPQREQIEHDIAQIFPVGGPIGGTGLATQYYDSKVYAEYTNNKRFLGKIYAMYITYERGLKKRLQAGIEGIEKEDHDRLSPDMVYNRIFGYGFAPMANLYLNNKIIEETNGEKTLDDVFKYISLNYKYKNISNEKYYNIVQKVTGYNPKNFFEEHVFGDYVLPLTQYVEKYKDDFNYQLEYIRNNQGLPPILYYAYLEIAANRGIPEFYLYQPPSFDINSNLKTQKLFAQFLKDLYQEETITKRTFIDKLNNYTDNTSNGFFEFYSEHTLQNPSLKKLNAYMNDEINSLISKLVYVNKSYNYFNSIDVKNSKLKEKIAALKVIINKSEDNYYNDSFKKAESNLNKAINKIDEIRKYDSDQNKIPNLLETSYDNNKFKNIKIDGYLKDWENINPQLAENKRGIFEKIAVYTGDKYLYFYIKSSKNFYNLKNGEINFAFDFDQNWGTEDGYDRYGFTIGGISHPIDEAIETHINLKDYVYVGKNILEMKIPRETLEILRFSKEVSLRVYGRAAKSNQVQIEPEIKWSKDLGSHQIDNIELY